MDFIYLKVRYQKGISRKNDTKGSLALVQDVILPKNLLIKNSIKPFKDALMQSGSCIIEVNASNEGMLTTTTTTNSILKGPQYFLWLGKCSDIADTVELPSRYGNDADLPQFSENDIVQIRFLTNVPYAKDVILVPKSEFDWDIIQNNASFIENNLLKSLSVVELSRDLTLPITSSIAAKVQIKDIILTDSSRPSSSKRFIARINNSTQLLIEPFPKWKEQEKVSKETNVPKTERNTESNNAQVHQENWIDGLDFTRFSFRVLPLIYRHIRADKDEICCNSKLTTQSKSLVLSEIHSENPIQKNNQKIKATFEDFLKDEDFLNSFLDPVPPPLPAQQRLTTGRQISPELPWEKEDQDPYLDASLSHYCNVFIHPFHLKLLIERQIFRNSSSSCFSKNEFSKYFQELSYPFIGIISIDSERIPPSDSGNVLPLSEQVYCRVLLTEHIRPFMISLPSQMMKALQISSFSSVKLKVLFHSPRLSVPSSISLTPIYWKNQSNVKNEDKNVKREEKLDVNVIIQAFLRFIENNSRPSFAFLLSHQSILSLDIPSSNILSESSQVLSRQNCSTIDFFVSFQYRKSKKDNNNNNNKMEPTYLPLSLENAMAEDFLSRVMSSLQLVANLPFHPLFTPESQIPTKNNLYFQTKNIFKVLSTLLDEISLNFTRQGILQQFQECNNLAPFNNDYTYLICGENHAGKSTFINYFLIPEIERQNFKFQCYIKSIDMKELLLPLQTGVSSVLEKIIASFDNLFLELRCFSPSILIIDNIDLLCTSLHSSLQQQQQQQSSSILRDEKLLILSTYFYRCLEEYYQTRKDKHLQLRELTRNCFNNPDQETCDERIISNYSEGNLFIIATCNSLQSLDTYLLTSPFGFTKYLTLSSTVPRKDERWNLLFHLLRTHEMPLKELVTQDEKEIMQKEEMIDGILHRMENYSFPDFQNLLKLIQFEVCYHFLLQESNENELPGLSTTIEDISQATVRYQSISSQSSSALQFLKLPNHQSTFTSSSSALTPTKSTNFQRLIFQSYFLLKPFQKMLETFHYPILYSKLYQGIQNKGHSEIRFPRSMMLFGAPGCGKTFLANAMGQFFESFGKVFMIKGPQLLNKYIGESEKSIRSLFEISLSFGCPVLLFFDEFESLAPKRGKDNTGITDRIVNQLLTFLDGVESTLSSGHKKAVDHDTPDEDYDDDDIVTTKGKGQIFLLIASSRPDLIDPALLRPGRIERHIHLGNPSNSAEYSELLRAMLAPYSPTTSSLSVATKNSDSDSTTLMTWRQTIDRMCEQPKMKEMTMADLQAIVDTAYLKAVHAAVDNGEKQKLKNNPESSKIIISSTILREAFDETKPSLSDSDRRFYENITNSFLRQQKRSPLLPPAISNNTNIIPDPAETDIDRLQKLSFH